MPKSYETASVKKLDGSRVEIAGSIASPVWEAFRSQAIKHLNDSISIDGFRKGNIPENILISKVGEMAVLEEMAELALPKAYVDILIENKIDAIGRPEIHVTKLAKGNPLEFKAVTAVVPEVKLPDYRKLAATEVGKNKVGEEKATDKEIDEAKEKTRIRIADAIAEKTGVELPDIMIESELHRTEAQFSADIERMGVKLDDYLKHAKKSLEDVRKEWRPHAEKKAKLQLILNEIAKTEKIEPSKEEIEAEVAHILEHYKDADRESAAIYAETVLTNEKVFQFLENPIAEKKIG